MIGTGLGGGVIVDGHVVKGRMGFGGELGHVLVPYQSIAGIEGLQPDCNCGRTGDLESLCSLTAITKTLLPYFLPRYPGPRTGQDGVVEGGETRARSGGKGRSRSAATSSAYRLTPLGLFFDEMVNTFDPDVLIIGGGALETGPEFQAWFIAETRAAMPGQRAEQAGIPIHVMPNGDTAGARGAAIEALQYARHGSVEVAAHRGILR